MKILFLSDCFLPHAGGARAYYHNLCKNLTTDWGDNITVLTKKVPGWAEFDRTENTESFQIVRSGTPLESWKYYEWPRIVPPLMSTAALIARHHFDIIHFGDLYPQGVISLWVKSLTGKPYVAYCHGEEITQTDRRRYQPKVRNAIYRGADAVVASSAFARENLLRIGVAEDRVHTITPGVDCNRFRPRPASRDLIARHGLEGKKVLLTVGRLVPRKGHRIVLELLRDLGPQAANIVFLIVGTGPEEKNLRQVTKEWGLSNVVRFAGFVDDADLPDYYNASDLFVLPAFEEEATGDVEGFGMVFLEANACGKAVLAGRCGGTAEAVLHGNTGILVDPKDRAELARSLQTLLGSQELRTALGESGLRRVRSEFSWAGRAQLLASVNEHVVTRATVCAQGQ